MPDFTLCPATKCPIPDLCARAQKYPPLEYQAVLDFSLTLEPGQCCEGFKRIKENKNV